MLHRAILGTLERFIGILIEQYAGKFPLWLAPTQVVVATIVNDADDYAQEVKALLDTHGIRSELDTDSEKINFKIRKHSMVKIPIILVLGKKEKADKTVSVRRLDCENKETLDLQEFVGRLVTEVKEPF